MSELNLEMVKEDPNPAKKRHNAHIEIDGELCKECLLCIEACAPDVLKVSET